MSPNASPPLGREQHCQRLRHNNVPVPPSQSCAPTTAGEETFYGAQETGRLGWSTPWLEEISALPALYSILWLALTDVPWPHRSDGGCMVQGLDEPTASLLEITAAADIGSNFLRLKKSPG